MGLTHGERVAEDSATRIFGGLTALARTAAREGVAVPGDQCTTLELRRLMARLASAWEAAEAAWWRAWHEGAPRGEL